MPKVLEQFKGKDVYGVFVAPAIDPNTAVEFFRKQRVIDGSLKDINIIPFTINQIKALLIKFGKTKFTVSELKEFLKSIIELQRVASYALEWNKLLYREINNWVKT